MVNKSFKLNNVKKQSLYTNFFLFLLLFILLYLIVYFYLIYPLYNLDRIYSKEEIKEITDLVILGAKDPSKLQELTNIKVNDLTFYYNYFIFRTETHCIFCLINMHNNTSSEGSIVLYSHDYINKHTENEIIKFDMDLLQTYNEKGGLVVSYPNRFRQEIHFDENKMKLFLSTDKNILELEMFIDEYNTTQPSFLNRYKIANNVVSTSFTETKSPNEWASDNPLIGKIIRGQFNQQRLNDGNFWFDNFIGCNNFFVSEYYWFFILNDDWIIYILFYGKYEDINTTDIPKCLFVKNRKDNKIMHCSCGVLPNGFKTMDRMIQPIRTNYTAPPTKLITEESFKEYSLSFESKEIFIEIRSIPYSSVNVLSYDYYNSPKYNASHASKNTKEFDQKYINVLNNLKYLEFLNKVDVDIRYNNNEYKFQEHQVVDCITPKNLSHPSIIRYEA
jgi:hypothetical protein